MKAYYYNFIHIFVILELINETGVMKMLWTLIGILVVLWFLGMVTEFVAGGLIHILLVIAVVLFIFNLITGRKRR